MNSAFHPHSLGRFVRRPRARCRRTARQDFQMDQRQRHPDLGHPFAEQRAGQRHSRGGVRVARVLQQQDLQARAGSGHGLEADDAHATAPQSAHRREVPRWLHLLGRRRGVLDRARHGQDLQLRHLRAGHRQGGQGGCEHHRHLHQGPQPGAAEPAHRAAHDEQGLGREEQLDLAERHQDARRKLCPPQRQWHRPVCVERMAARPEDGAHAQPELVGQVRRQRDRGDLHAGEGGGHAHGGAAVR